MDGHAFQEEEARRRVGDLMALLPKARSKVVHSPLYKAPGEDEFEEDVEPRDWDFFTPLDGNEEESEYSDDESASVYSQNADRTNGGDHCDEPESCTEGNEARTKALSWSSSETSMSASTGEQHQSRSSSLSDRNSPRLTARRPSSEQPVPLMQGAREQPTDTLEGVAEEEPSAQEADDDENDETGELCGFGVVDDRVEAASRAARLLVEKGHEMITFDSPELSEQVSKREASDELSIAQSYMIDAISATLGMSKGKVLNRLCLAGVVGGSLLLCSGAQASGSAAAAQAAGGIRSVSLMVALLNVVGGALLAHAGPSTDEDDEDVAAAAGEAAFERGLESGRRLVPSARSTVADNEEEIVM